MVRMGPALLKNTLITIKSKQLNITFKVLHCLNEQNYKSENECLYCEEGNTEEVENLKQPEHFTQNCWKEEDLLEAPRIMDLQGCFCGSTCLVVFCQTNLGPN